MHHNLKFPREVGSPRREVVYNKEQFLAFVNNNLSSANLYTNVYNYTEFRDGYYYPFYDSAIIDRIYFDIDQKIKENGEEIKIDAYESMIKIHKWCLENGYLHFPRCTGSAYDVVILTDPNIFIRNKKDCIANAQRWLCKNLDIKTDPQVVGDIARIHRIENTFNHKPQTRRFCIPLDPEIIFSGEKAIFEVAQKQRFTSNQYGSKYWDIGEFDTAESQYIDELQVANIDIDESQFADLSVKIPDCIKTLLSRRDLNWQERRNVIICLRDNCYLIREVESILRKHLSSKKFRHCIQEEKQLQYLYKNDKYFFPWQDSLLALHACPFKLGKYCNKANNGCLLYGRQND